MGGANARDRGISPRRAPVAAFAWSVPIAALGGLIGLGGAEFRLPVLAGWFRYEARQAVALNLAVSLATVVAALIWRSLTLDLTPLGDYLPLAAAMIIGSVAAAWVGVGWAEQLSRATFTRLVFALLLMVGVLLLAESVLPLQAGSLAEPDTAAGWVTGAAAGIGIGLFSSVLGVAGGELIIPTLVYVFGVDIKLAGSASLIISVPTLLVGIGRFMRLQAYAARGDVTLLIAPMAIGSVIGAGIGAALADIAPDKVLKAVLGVILIASALKVFGRAN